MKVAIFSKIWPETIEELKKNHDCIISINPEIEEKHKIIRDVEAVILRSPVKLDQETLSKAKNLKLILRAGMGLDTIDVEYAKKQGSSIAIVPLSATSAAEHAIGLMLALHRRIPWFHQTLKENRWEKGSYFASELNGKMLGLIGFGRIGRTIADISKAFNMDLQTFDRSPLKSFKTEIREKLGVKLVDLSTLLKTSDVISIQTPLNEQTRNLINKENISTMKKTSMIINVGRGGIIDENALQHALANNNIGGAALDVFEKEPPKDNPLLNLDNFIGTPHIAAQTINAQKKIGDDVLQIVDAYNKGLELRKYAIVV